MFKWERGLRSTTDGPIRPLLAPARLLMQDLASRVSSPLIDPFELTFNCPATLQCGRSLFYQLAAWLESKYPGGRKCACPPHSTPRLD